MQNNENTVSSTGNILYNAFEYYDKNTEKYEEIFKKVNFISFILIKSEAAHSVMVFYDYRKRELFRSRYEIIGQYDNIVKTWTWSWAIARFLKNSTIIARKIINYGFNLDDSPGSLFLKTELITSRFKITNEVQLDIHAAVSSYLSKQKIVFKYYKYSMFGSNDFYNNIRDVPENEKDKFILFYLFLLDDMSEENDEMI
jgi:hypothetical protein